MTLPIPDVAPPPLSLRTDAMGIFAVLAFSGAAQLVGPIPNSLNVLIDQNIGQIWATTLLVFGLLGLVSTFMLGPRQILGLGLELVARVALGFGAATYSAALWTSIGWDIGTFAILTYAGISTLLLVGAWQIWRWLRLQRRVVTAVMHEQAE